MEPQLNAPPIMPTIALIINLSLPDESGQNIEKPPVLARQIGNLGLAATWVIDGARQAKILGQRLLATDTQELAVTTCARSPQRLRRELADLQAAVQATSGHVVSMIVGDAQHLRAHTAVLADLGFRAVVSNARPTETSRPARLLPCGLWQLDPAVTLPQPRHRWSLFPTRQLTVAQLFATGSVSQPIALSVDPSRLSDRDLQGCQRLLQEIAEANRQQQLAVATVNDVVAQLVSQHEVKPQRSILRRAA